MRSVRESAARTWSELPLRFKGALVVALPLAALLLAAVSLMIIEAEDERAGAWTEHTVEVRYETQRVLQLLVDAESSMRGYLLTGEPDFLEPYRLARQPVSGALEQLGELVRDNPDHARRAARITALAERRLSTLDALPAYAPGPDRPRAAAPVERLRAGRELMDTLRAEVAAMQAEEERLLAQRVAFEKRMHSILQVATVVGVVVGLAGGIAAMLLFTRGIARRVQHLAANADRLARGLPLEPAPLGSDEIGQASDSIVSAAGLLAERERELRDSQAFLESIVENIPAMVFVKDATDLRFVRFNRAGEELLGYTRDELLGRSDRDFFPPDEAEFFIAKDRQVLESGELLDIPDEPIQTRHQGMRTLHTRKIPILDDNGQPRYLLGISEDITDRKRAEDALREARDELEARVRERTAELTKANEALQLAQEQVIQQERLRALGQMASGIAHDLNNTLAPIVGYSELLLIDPGALENPAQVREYLDLMSTAAQDAAGVVGRLREFYRPREPGEAFQPVDLPSLVAQVISLTQPRWRDQAQAQGVAILVETEVQDVPRVLGSAPELREALTNLVFNAVDAMPHGGTVTIRARAEDAWVVLEVVDTGVGMTDQVRQRCLEPFFTTKGERGTGLGLGMVYGIVQRHAGELDILSAPGKGTAIVLRLPAEQQGETGAASDAPPSRRTRQLRVLVVEDEQPVRRMLRDFLVSAGHTVEVASDGRQGLELFRGGRFDLVITDRAMPEMHGDQLALEVKRREPDMPVIMLTGFGELMAAADERPPGVDLVISKPITPTVLRQAVERVVPHAE